MDRRALQVQHKLVLLVLERMLELLERRMRVQLAQRMRVQLGQRMRVQLAQIHHKNIRLMVLDKLVRVLELHMAWHM